jgi:hypothetical protein
MPIDEKVAEPPAGGYAALFIEETLILLLLIRGITTFPPGTIDVIEIVDRAEQPIVFVTTSSPTIVRPAGAPALMVDRPTRVLKVLGVTDVPPPGGWPFMDETFREEMLTPRGDTIFRGPFTL